MIEQAEAVVVEQEIEEFHEVRSSHSLNMGSIR